jgi:DTW domain-containing protein YfiP
METPEIFDRIHVSSFETLQNAVRTRCPSCGSFRKYFCYECCVPLVENFPHIDLPAKALILKCKKEPRSKSSVVVVKVICPESSEIADCLGEDDSIPVFEPGSWVLFPGPEAKSFNELTDEEIRNIKQLIFIDSTWHQTKSMLRNQNLNAVPKLKLENHTTAFWRYQSVSKHSLATVEAVFYAYEDYHEEMHKRGFFDDRPIGRYDNLLWMFKFNYALIQKEYTEGTHKNKNFRHMPGYIKKNFNK